MDKLHEIIEKMEDCMYSQVCGGIENVDTEEMYKAADIFKDLCEAEYHCKITKAMEESTYGEDYDYEGRKYTRMRDSRGRYMYHDDMMHDERKEDWKSGRMHYSEPMESDYDRTRRMYTETKQMKPHDKQEHLKKLNDHLDVMARDTREVMGNLTAEERTTWKQRLINLANEM